MDESQATADAAQQISLSIQTSRGTTEQVLTNLREIESGAKQASSSINQISSISKDLINISDNLSDLINKFRLDNVDDLVKSKPDV